MNDDTDTIGTIVDTSAALLLILNRERLCERCGFIYKERANIGQWQCRKYHALFNYTPPQGPTYKCCGRALGEDGCVAADHHDRLHERTEPTRVAPHTARLLDENSVRVKHAHTDPRTGVLLIDRYDVLEYERRTHPTYAVPDELTAQIEAQLAQRNL